MYYATYSMLTVLHTISIFRKKLVNVDKSILVLFGNKVSKLRKDLNLSQEELAFKSGLHRTYVGMIERAERNITLLNIEKIAKGLGVSIDELFRF